MAYNIIRSIIFFVAGLIILLFPKQVHKFQTYLIKKLHLKLKLKWKGKGINTKAYDEKGNCIIECDKKYFRPTEVDILLGNANKAKKILKWKPKTNIDALVKEMIDADLKNI